MTEFNQAKFESDAKKLVAKCLNYEVNEKDGSTSKVKVDADKVQVSVETKCPICQEHHDILGLTNAFDLHLQDDFLVLMDKSSHNDIGFPKDAFKIKYCPFCGRPLNEEDSDGESIDKSPISSN